MSEETVRCLKCGRDTGVKARPPEVTTYPDGGFTSIGPVLVLRCKLCRDEGAGVWEQFLSRPIGQRAAKSHGLLEKVRSREPLQYRPPSVSLYEGLALFHQGLLTREELEGNLDANEAAYQSLLAKLNATNETQIFGSPWGPGAFYEASAIAPTPVGALCARCDEPIADGESGILIAHIGEPGVVRRAWHRECYVRNVVGSVGHQLQRCSCFGGDEEDPPNMTKREAARAAMFLAWNQSIEPQ